MSDEIRTIDLFAGAGGLSLGFDMVETANFKTVYGVEHQSAAARTFKSSFDTSVYDGDIELLDPKSYPEADLVLGGPPCQGFSTLGRTVKPAARAQMNDLWVHYLNAVKVVRPRAFVIENVPQFHSSEQFQSFRSLMGKDKQLSDYGYAYGVLNAADYGVPQLRKRGILIAVHGRKVPWPPPPTHSAKSSALAQHRTVREAIHDLPANPTTSKPFIDADGRQDLHISRNPTVKSLERYRVIPPGGNRFDLQRARPDITPSCWLNKPKGTTDVMGRMWWDRPAPTIRTEFYKPEKGRYLHPSEDRPITHREAARIQSFPDQFIFEGSKVEIARQIGNAVPPLLGKAIGEFVATLLDG